MTEPETTDERLAAVTVGEPERLDAPIRLVPYDLAWPAQYERLARSVRDALGHRVLLLEHVGSTAVPGLSAKPVIDMVLAVADSADEAAYVPPFEANGFVLRIREPDWYEHRVLRGTTSPANLHVFSVGCEEIDRMLAFRDWLRENEADRRLYEEAKQALAARTWQYTQHYADAKSRVVREIVGRALAARAAPRERR